MLPIRIILHATDFSESSAYAFRLACSLARDYSARLVMLHVAEQPVVVPIDGSTFLPPPLDRERLLKDLQCWQAQEPGVRIEYRLAEGDPAAEIVRAAAETGCDLIVMGTHGRAGLGRLLLGSVAEQVLRRAPCPVMTMKIPHPQAQSAQENVPHQVHQTCDAAKA